jgi:hypothetical protein
MTHKDMNSENTPPLNLRSYSTVFLFGILCTFLNQSYFE